MNAAASRPRVTPGVTLLIAVAGLALLAILQSPPLPFDGVVGAKVSYSRNALSGDEALTFDHVHFERGGDLFDLDQPDRLTAPVAGCYEVGAQVTILGDAYDSEGLAVETADPDSRVDRVSGREDANPPNPHWWMLIRRNGDDDDYLAAARENPAERHGVAFGEAHTVACLSAGDYIQLFVTPNRMVESNWPGTGGSISPVLYMVLIAA
jgi:hypothetical protein